MNCSNNSCIIDYLRYSKLDDVVRDAGGESMVPYVKVYFKDELGEDKVIMTVGNKPSPDWDNTAIIKSFQYGSSDGNGIKMEIHDVSSSSFAEFFDKLAKCIGKSKDDFKTSVEWGWIIQRCVSGRSPVVRMVSSPKFYFLITNIETMYEGGKLKFNVTAQDLMQNVFASRHHEVKGKDDEAIPITQAIRKIANDNEPRLDVEFLMLKNGILKELIWSDGTPEGPKGKYSTDGSNKLQAIRELLNNQLSVNNKGLHIVSNPSRPNPTLCVVEDPIDCKDEILNLNDDSPWIIGRYAVNSGKCLHGKSRIETEDGWKLIGNLYRNKYKGKARCLDENGNLSWSNVYAWHRNPLDNRKLFKLNLLHSRKHYKNICGGIFTEDHEILTNYGYLKINELIKNKHKINSGTYALSKDCLNAFIGTMLGDSYFFKKTFECKHSLKQYEYCKYKANIFNCNFKEKTNKCLYSSKVNPFLRKMNELFYKEGIKKINEEVLKDFNLISLAFLFMDDGSTEFRKNKQPRSQIAVCKFTDEEVDLLVKKIKELGIDCYRRKNKYNRIFFDVENTKILSKSIATYVLKLFNYKILEEHRNIEKTIIKNSQELFYDDFNLIKVDKTPKWVYCIGVEKYENFLTSSGIVHNCSPVISFNPKIDWISGMAAVLSSGGNSGGSNSGGSLVQNNQCVGQPPEAGSAKSVAVPEDMTYRLGRKEAGPNTMNAQNINDKASRRLSVEGKSITAELIIQGDPKAEYISPPMYLGRYISLVVFNSFNLLGTEDDYCPNWVIAGLKKKSCNEILSNKRWLVTGATHYIKEGTYTTTLQLSLLMPGIDIAPDLPIGGTDSLGYVPKNTC